MQQKGLGVQWCLSHHQDTSGNQIFSLGKHIRFDLMTSNVSSNPKGRDSFLIQLFHALTQYILVFFSLLQFFPPSTLLLKATPYVHVLLCVWPTEFNKSYLYEGEWKINSKINNNNLKTIVSCCGNMKLQCVTGCFWLQPNHGAALLLSLHQVSSYAWVNRRIIYLLICPAYIRKAIWKSGKVSGKEGRFSINTIIMFIVVQNNSFVTASTGTQQVSATSNPSLLLQSRPLLYTFF